MPDAVNALLAWLHHDPADHAARLALADALEEAGRAEQAEVARLHARQLMRAGSWEELDRLCALLARGVQPVVPEVVNTIGQRLALVPPGRFLMGSPEEEAGRDKNEGPRHEVELTRPFYLGVYEVTQGQYERVMANNPSYFSQDGGGKDMVAGLDTSDFPVEYVSWEEAVELCRKLTEQERIEGKIGPDQEYRLPTEAEWEYACRGGASSSAPFHATSSAPFHFGDQLSSDQANFDGRHPYGGAEMGDYLQRTTQVGSYPPNAFGLYDMHGNVFEWCADWYGADTYKAAPRPRRDPLGPPEGSGRVFRGGSWDSFGQECRAAGRVWGSPGHVFIYLGFRVVLVWPGGK